MNNIMDPSILEIRDTLQYASLLQSNRKTLNETVKYALTA